MNTPRKQLGWLVATMVLVVSTGGTAIADDTELFLSGVTSGISGGATTQPNILFVIDTSGSMNSQVMTQEGWDDSVNYSGCYESNRIYFSSSTSQPSCSTSRWFWKTRNHCEASFAQLVGIGVWSGALRGWRERSSGQDTWDKLKSGRTNRPVECADDVGVHGEAAGDSEVYAANGDSAGPWSSNSNAPQPNWNISTRYLFNGNYLNFLQSEASESKSRMEIVKEVTDNLLGNIEGVNVGLMRFNFEHGGPVIHAIEDINVARTSIRAAVEDLDASGWTPMTETMYEGYLYFSGGEVDYGDGHEDVSVAPSRIGGVLSSDDYNSPMDLGCQRNFAVLLTDGEPTKDTGAEDEIEDLDDFASLVGQTSCSTEGRGYADGKCLNELTKYMHQGDLSDLDGQQNVTTYTIGFLEDLGVLADAAEDGGGKYFLADDTTELTAALTDITLAILKTASTFTAPSVPVNAFNRTQNLNDVFVSLFEPTGKVHWSGNTKRYRLVDGVLSDQLEDPAVDPDTGFLTSTAHSYWSAEPDGDRTTEGGAANEQPAWELRNVYTNMADPSPGLPVDLNAVSNIVADVNTAITAEMLDAPLTERTEVLNWINGLDYFDENDNDDTTDTRNVMGDPLHVRPAPVIYGGTEESPDMVIFNATNDGYMHAIDADDGSELWSFVPRRLLSRMHSLFQDDLSATRAYGLDGEIMPIILNNNNVPGISGAERVILLFGMRRGGSAVFAVEVTDRNDPQLLWEISADDADFVDMGQSWSMPQYAKINVGGDDREVAIFGGGYDTAQDSYSVVTDSVGNAIYMVDVLTGVKIWSAGPGAGFDLQLSDMDYSIPAPIKVLDINYDHRADRMYVGDMGGQVWRFDIANGNDVLSLVDGGVFASLGAAASPTVAATRRFYSQVDVVDVAEHSHRYLSIHLGSGYRAHVLDEDVDEEFYALRDYDVFNQLEAGDYGTPIERDDMVDITGIVDPELDDTSAGWRLTLDIADGEKSLSRAISFAGIIYFTTFAPQNRESVCDVKLGSNWLYKVDVLNGNPIVTGTPEPEDRTTDLQQGGIAPEAIFLFPKDRPDKPIICIGLECEDSNVVSLPAKSYWTKDGS